MKSVSVILILIISQSIFAADISVVDVRRNIPLSDDEPVIKDFYLNAGVDDGIKKNLVVTVYRGLNIRDASGAQSFGEIIVPVGQLQVVSVYPKLSVAREYKVISRDENAMLEQPGIMNGDKVELKDSFVGRRPQSTKKAVVQTVPAPVPTPAVVALPVPIPVAAELTVSPLKTVPEEVAKTAQAPNPVNNTPPATTPPPPATAPASGNNSQP